MKLSVFAGSGVVILFAAQLFGQIVIDWTEIPQDIGIMFTHNGAESVTVNLGIAGGPQNWDFTGQPMGSQNTDVLIVPRTSTPFGDSFPNSNLVLQIIEPGYTAYAYGQIAPTFGANLGLGSTVPVAVFFRFEPTDSYPMPVVYGATRHYEYGYTLGIGPLMEIRTDNYGSEMIDAYGSIAVPYGMFECLRTRQFDTTVSTMYVNGIPITADTTTHIIYDFLAEDYGLIAHVQSYPEETDTNFTDADFLERITNFSTGIEELESTAGYDFSCQPNPFTRETRIRYTMHDTRYMEQEFRNSNLEMQEHTMRIYDATGRLVKSYNLGSGIVNRESAISWHGDDDTGRKLPSGIYFLQLDDGKETCTGKITLVR